MEDLKVYRGTIGRNKAVIVKLPRPVELKGATNKSIMVEPIWVLGQEDGTGKVEFVYAPKVFETPKFAHYNVQERYDYSTFITKEPEILEALGKNPEDFPNGYQLPIKTRYFCNPISMNDLYEDTETVAHVIAMQLEEPNPSNAYGNSTDRVERYVNPLGIDPVIKCKRCDRAIKNNEGEFSMILGLCPDCLKKCLENPSSLSSYMEDIETTGYYGKLTKQRYYKHLKRMPKKIESYSKYYPIIDATILDNIENVIPKKNVDMLLLGCGSAGSSIVEQLSRTKMIESYMLVDFDGIEAKNLRNQLYYKGDIGCLKTERLKRRILDSNVENIKVESHSCKFQDVNYKFYNFMFTVLAFDSINTRLEAFKYIQEGKIKTKFIVDTRYDDLECSIYFVDTEDENQMKYYEQSLLSDKAELDKVKAKKLASIVELDKVNPKWTAPRVRKYWEDNLGFISECRACKYKLCPNGGSMLCSSKTCGSSQCVDDLVKYLNDNNATVHPSVKSIELDEADIKYLSDLPNDNSCYHYNIVDIYKYASTFITCTIRSLYNSRPKKFTHVEVSTESIPTSMVIM